MEMGTFMYFGYGSNLLRERLQIQNPSAVFKTVGRLDGYKLDFRYKSKNWHGASATITEEPGEQVWGCVWILENKDLKSLDDQEGVSRGVYKPLEIEVISEGGEKLQCRTYQLAILNAEDRRPSPQYLSVILKGAEQNNLPQEYLKKLKSIEHNGYTGECRVFDENLAHLVQKN